jgi:[ribosomal protein S5]-alanine N-acetyltransferase
MNQAVKFMNSDRCTSDFYYKTINEMKSCIRFRLDEYKSKSFIRLSVIDKQKHKVVRTIEMFGGKKFRVLRIDLKSDYERGTFISEILGLVNTYFYNIFNTSRIVSKAIPEATERIAALTAGGYIKLEDKSFLPLPSYYCR